MFISQSCTRNSSNEFYFSWKTPFIRISMVLRSCRYEYQLGEVSTSEPWIALVHYLWLVKPLIMHYKSNTTTKIDSTRYDRPSQIQSRQNCKCVGTTWNRTPVHHVWQKAAPVQSYCSPCTAQRTHILTQHGYIFFPFAVIYILTRKVSNQLNTY